MKEQHERISLVDFMPHLLGYMSTMSTVAAVNIIHFNVPKFPSLRSSVRNIVFTGYIILVLHN